MDNSMIAGFSLIAGLVLDLAALVAAARFLLQAAEVDGYNPIAQYVIQVTNPVLAPFRIILPSQGRVDMHPSLPFGCFKLGRLRYFMNRRSECSCLARW